MTGRETQTDRPSPDQERLLALDIRRATKRYGNVVALDDVSVSATRGEFLTMLGQSGSGKTTLLKLIGGLEHPSSIERLAIGGADVLGLPPYRRNVTTVFQHYALFPHMTVAQNVAYPLRLRGVAGADAARQVAEMLRMVRLPDKGDRRISQLSGGERQRVALARSLICRPDVLLLDEPLGALDERLRLDMQIELTQLQRHFGMTFVYITHSQEEALTMSDRVLLMREGRIVQEGRPRDLFETPQNDFVGRFMGIENIVRGKVSRVDGGKVSLTTDVGELTGTWTGRDKPAAGGEACLMIRAEKIRFSAQGLLAGRIEASVYKGRYVEHVIGTELGPIHMIDWSESRDVSGEVRLGWDQGDAKIAPLAG